MEEIKEVLTRNEEQMEEMKEGNDDENGNGEKRTIMREKRGK